MKLVHDGLHDLEFYEFGLAREALIQREILWQIAPSISAHRVQTEPPLLEAGERT